MKNHEAIKAAIYPMAQMLVSAQREILNEIAIGRGEMYWVDWARGQRRAAQFTIKHFIADAEFNPKQLKLRRRIVRDAIGMWINYFRSQNKTNLPVAA